MTSIFAPERLVYEYELERGEFSTVAEETSKLKRALLNIGFPADATRRALIVAYELSMNVVIHAFSGTVKVLWKDGGLEIVVEDSGPGIHNVELAMQEGYSTAPSNVKELGFGVGMGLPNSRKHSDFMELTSTPGEGTRVLSRILPGPQDMVGAPYFHSVRLQTDKCKGCTNCIKGCPTEAIRVRGGKAFILEDRCIDCGECIRQCPNHAKVAIADEWAILDNYDYKIGLIAPSFYGQFHRDISPGKIRAALCAPGGFDEVFDVSIAADLVSSVTRNYINKTHSPRPLISSACPAVVRLIQVKFPSLLKHLVPCEAPMEIAAWLAKNEAHKKHPERSASTFFISPCPAKITAARQPVGRGRSLVDAVISMQEAYSWVREHISSVTEEMDFPTSSGYGIGWGRSGGEMLAAGVQGLAVDGITQVASVLEEVEKGELDYIDYIEAQACIGGCVGGALTVANSYVSRTRIRDLANAYIDLPPNPILADVTETNPAIWMNLEILPRPIFKLDEDVQEARNKLELLENIEHSLPGLDCGACGAPKCRALAEDIVLGRGSVWDCTFKLRERLESLAQEIKDLAGKKPPAMGQLNDNVSEEENS